MPILICAIFIFAAQVFGSTNFYLKKYAEKNFNDANASNGCIEVAAAHSSSQNCDNAQPYNAGTCAIQSSKKCHIIEAITFKYHDDSKTLKYRFSEDSETEPSIFPNYLNTITSSLYNLSFTNFFESRQPIHQYLETVDYTDDTGKSFDYLYTEVNKLPISSEKYEYEAKLLSQSNELSDTLHLTIHHVDAELTGCIAHEEKQFDLNLKLFEAAVYTANIDRLNELFVKGKQFTLKPEQKAGIMKFALLRCDFKDESTSARIFKKLLQNGFYPDNNEFPVLNVPFDSSYPFRNVIYSEQLYEIFLDYDKDIFAKQTVNYVKMFIENWQYNLAREALRLGFDPSVAEDGRNALDVALDYSSNSRLSRGDLENIINLLKYGYGVKPSYTI